MSFYESDSPCRRCNGTTRYRDEHVRGQCVTCFDAGEIARQARSFVVVKADESDEDEDEDE